MLLTNPLPSVGQAFALISQEESHRSLMNDSFAPPENIASAFFPDKTDQEIGKKMYLHVTIAIGLHTLSPHAINWLDITWT